MSEHMSDDQLLELLDAALDAADPVPEALLEAARAAFTWRTIDEELASLVFDSAAEELAGVRSVDTARQLTFSTRGVEIELVVLSETTRRIVGQLVPPRTAEIVLHHESGERRSRSDDLGRFTIDAVPVGSVRLSFTLEGTVVHTEWTII